MIFDVKVWHNLTEHRVVRAKSADEDMERALIAKHEAGHAIVAVAVGGGFKCIKMTLEHGLFPGGFVIPDEKHYKLSLEARAIMYMGGLAGERVGHKKPGTVFVDSVAPATVRGAGGDLAAIHEDFGIEPDESYIETCYTNAWNILQANKNVHRKLVALLTTRDSVLFKDIALLTIHRVFWF